MPGATQSAANDLLPTAAILATQSLQPTIQPSVTPIPASPTLPAATTASPLPAATDALPTAIPLPSVIADTPAPIAPPVSLPEPGAAAGGTIDPALAAELQAILDNLVADGWIPGAVLTVHIPGQAPWTGASGYIDRQRTQPLTAATRMRIASISKVFTAVVVLQLMEEGRLSLDSPLSTWFPSLVPSSDAITVRMLLNHTTGLYDFLEDGYFLGKAYQAPDYHWPPSELVSYAAQAPSLFSPGAPGAWDYSSTNYVILGMIAEAVTGRPLATEMRERIFQPLGLTQTYFAPDEAVEGVVARGYRNSNDVTAISLSFAFATANLVSTTEDVQRFGAALFGGQLLRPETMEQVYVFQNGKGQYLMPALEYGLGVMRNLLPVGPDASGNPRPAEASTVMGHTGGFGGFRSVLWHEPVSGITIALGENQGATDPNILATKALDAVLRSQGR
jgi:D-alanyl-D-alanine carboxypeptidase